MSAPQKTPRRYLLGLAVALLLPLSFYVIAKWLHKDEVSMPRYFLSKGIDSTVNRKGERILDTVYHHVGSLRGVNQLGDSIDLNKDLEGRFMVVNFFFTSCPTICPKLTKNMHLLQNAYRKTAMKKNDEIVQFVSISVNPERDSPRVLRAYADKYSANHDHWWFVTGNRDSIFSYARNELKAVDPAGDGGEGEFVHTQTFVLLDKNRHVRGYYNGLDSLEVERCARDIGWLHMEKHPKP